MNESDQYEFKDGGPAFPTGFMGVYHGMSLRDWFAGQVLPTMLFEWLRGDLEESYQKRVEDAYRIADAMIKERKK